ncbi:MAG: CoA-binding protein [bacterium]|nr:CoA-binding protein [bacterium]
MAEKTIAIIGASNNRTRFSNKAVRAYLAQGYTVYPVNPHEESVEGLTAFREIGEIPGEVETVSVYLRPENTLTVLDAIAAKAPREVYLNPGTESPAVLKRAEELGLNVVEACSIIAAGRSPAEFS